MDKFKYIKKKWSWEPHPTQREFMEYESKIKIGACGRRWGKSEALAYDMAYYFLTKKNYSQMIVSPTYDQSKLIFRTLEDLLYDITGVKIKKTPYSVIKKGKNIITARTADNDGSGLRGNKADRIVVDEAAFIKDQVVYEVISPMLADTNGDLVLISTPFGKNYFYDFYQRGLNRSYEIASFSYKSVDNPYINKEYIEKQKANMSSLSYETEYEAKFCDNISNVFKYDIIKESINREMKIEGGQVVIGVDFARYSDWTVCMAVESDGYLFKVLEMNRFQKVSWEDEIRKIMDMTNYYDTKRLICDATGVGDPLCEMIEKELIRKNMGTELIPFRFTNQSKNQIIDNINALLETRRLSIINDPVLIDELKNFEYSLSDSGKVILNARYNHHDDCVCALALACQGAADMGTNSQIYSY